MLKSDREALQRNFTVLVEEVPCIEVLAFLYQERILNQEMVSKILIEPLHPRNFSLIFLLQTRGPKAFSAFLDALRYAKAAFQLGAMGRDDEIPPNSTG